MKTKPNKSYTIWFSQRTGSTLLCKALEDTGIAGIPREWFNHKPGLLEDYRLTDHAELQQHLWDIGSTPNGIFGVKHSFYEPHFSKLIDTLRNFPTCPPNTANRKEVWESAFPSHRHIFITRRNKVKLAVSWWKMIQTGQGHRTPGESLIKVDTANAYSFDAINHLYNECSMREAGIQEFFSEGKITPLTIVYEDFIQDYEKTVQTFLEFLELDIKSVTIAPPYYDRTADSISEEWVQRFREERQQGWDNRGW